MGYGGGDCPFCAGPPTGGLPPFPLLHAADSPPRKSSPSPRGSDRLSSRLSLNKSPRLPTSSRQQHLGFVVLCLHTHTRFTHHTHSHHTPPDTTPPLTLPPPPPPPPHPFFNKQKKAPTNHPPTTHHINHSCQPQVVGFCSRLVPLV